MIVVERIAELRARLDAARARGATVGFVPTMGALHEGHRSLLRAARNAHDVVVLSIFVNPLQFDRAADLDAYPRDLTADALVADAEGVDFLFAPTTGEMYPQPVVTKVTVAGLTDGLCGAGRPGHFDGVATVVAKLFAIVGPATAYFGRKDAQQLAVVRRLASDLDLAVTVVGCPLVREPDGLALSSRNVHLDGSERAAALVLSRALRAAAAAVDAGERSADAVRTVLRAELATEPIVRVEYAEVVDGASLQPIDELPTDGDVLIAIAAFVGPTRLIDNVTVAFHHDRATPDLGITVAPSRESEAPCAAG